MLELVKVYRQIETNRSWNRFIEFIVTYIFDGNVFNVIIRVT